MGIADDIGVCGSTEAEHDQAFCEMLKATRKHNVSLAKLWKAAVQVDTSRLLRTHSDREWDLTSEGKTWGNSKHKEPIKHRELQTILGMVTYLNCFSTKLADLTSPLRELTKKHIHFGWETHHHQALYRIKQELCTSQLISYYDPEPNTPTILQCDASKTGIGP